jgi:NAD(P)-dependent dehydrogenase (short-subunit alcohol dehydrogenase family)
VTAGGFDLSGRTVLVTGAASGIGAATARVCAAQGARVVLVDREDAVPLAGEIGGTSFRADVASRAEVEAVVAAAGPVDALVASAAVCPWDDWEDPGWDEAFGRVMAVNLLGGLHFARALMPGMASRGWGRMVLVGSLAGRNGGLIASPHYVASKGGLFAVVKWLARRAAPSGVVVNGIAPASVRTPMMADQPVDLARIPVGRMAEPEEVAWPIAFLCSPAASYVCGTILDVNGGVWMS